MGGTSSASEYAASDTDDSDRGLFGGSWRSSVTTTGTAALNLAAAIALNGFVVAFGCAILMG